MKRKEIVPRQNWQESVEQLGFAYHHTLEGLYWDESACYEFTNRQIEELETATNNLNEMCLEAVEHIIERDKFDLLHIPRQFVPFLRQSWQEDFPTVYGRFDFVYDGKTPPKMLEFNADTPTSLFEASIVQWFWLQDFAPQKDQFNSLHEKLIAHWQYLQNYLHKDITYFSCVDDNIEDFVTVQYLRDCAIQAGLETEFIYIEEIGSGKEVSGFYDLQGRLMKNIFKLYPWEWMVTEEFAESLLLDVNNTFWIEPPWKMILSNKGILPVLWEMFPNHPNLLPAFFEGKQPYNKFNDYVKKPLLSREGANIEIVENRNKVFETTGDYGSEGFILQTYKPLPNFSGNFPVIGSWVIGGEAAGIGIRESKTIVTDNTSRFIPHLIV